MLSRWKRNVNHGALLSLRPGERVPAVLPPFGAVLELIFYVLVGLLNRGFFLCPMVDKSAHGPSIWGLSVSTAVHSVGVVVPFVTVSSLSCCSLCGLSSDVLKLLSQPLVLLQKELLYK